MSLVRELILFTVTIRPFSQLFTMSNIPPTGVMMTGFKQPSGAIHLAATDEQTPPSLNNTREGHDLTQSQ